MTEYKFYIQKEITVNAENFEEACEKFGSGDYTVTDEEITDLVFDE